MNPEQRLILLLDEFWARCQQPTVLWQLGVVVACLLVAWLLERWVIGRWYRAQVAATPTTQPHIGHGWLSLQSARAALGRVLFPAFAAGLILLTRPLLGIWQPTALLRVALVLLGALALVRGIVYLISRLVRTPLITVFERLLVALVWLAVALNITGYGTEVIALAESVVVPVGKERVSLWTIASASFWVLATQLVALWVGGVLETRLLALDAGDMGVRVVLARVMRAVLLLLAILVGLSLVGLDLTALSVFGGALGVGIGLGLQRIASSYISGFVVLLERRVRLGDFVTVDKYHGQVIEIRTRFTVIRSGEGWESIVPNEMLMANPVQNFSMQTASRLKSRVSVAYGTDLDGLLPRLEALARAHPRVLPEPVPAALLVSFGVDGLELELGYSIADAEINRPSVQSDINRAILALLRETGVEIPYPQREIRLLNPAREGYTSPHP